MEGEWNKQSKQLFFNFILKHVQITTKNMFECNNKDELIEMDARHINSTFLDI